MNIKKSARVEMEDNDRREASAEEHPYSVPVTEESPDILKRFAAFQAKCVERAMTPTKLTDPRRKRAVSGKKNMNEPETLSAERGADSVQRRCSAFETRILAMMSKDRYTTARLLAEQVWSKKRNGVGHRNGQWQKMGAVLRKLKSKGLVTYRVTDHGQNEWRRVHTPNRSA